MANSIRHDFHTDLATLLATDIYFQNSKYYYYLGKVEPWVPIDVVPTLMQENSDLENSNIRSNILYLKSINSNDISIVVNRYQWVPNKVFSSWDNTLDMKDLEFYCVNSENNVYKCLDNNVGALSTVEPTGNSFTITKTSDGYTWKYMYNIPAFKDIRFSSLNYIPVQKSLTDSFYNKGSVNSVAVANAGTGYTNTPVTTLSVSGSTTGSGAAGTLLVGPIGNIIGVDITSGGSGYTAGVDITFVSTAGTGGVGTATIVAGVVTDITISAAGIGYQDGDAISFTVGGGEVIPFISTVTGEVVGTKIINSGAGYISPPTITINTSALVGTGKYGNPTALFESVIYQGKIVHINIIDPGVDYSTDTSTIITVTGNGVGAEFSPIIYDGGVIGVVVDNPGEGYTDIKLNVVGTGTGAILNPVILLSDFMSDQSVVEQTTVPGAIYSIKITNGGNNYSHNTIVNILGDGIGCTAVPVITDGVVTKIQIVTPGEGYTYTDVLIVDASRNVDVDNIDATAYCILPPTGGHGFDATSELFGRILSINSSLRPDTTLLSLYQDYRQFGILKDPTYITTGKKFTQSVTLIAYTVEFDTTVGLVKDEILLFNNVKFRVVAIDGNKVTLQQLGIKYIDPVGVMVSFIENVREYTSTKILKYPEVNKYSGKLLYISNETPFSFSEEQGITIKTFLQF